MQAQGKIGELKIFGVAGISKVSQEMPEDRATYIHRACGDLQGQCQGYLLDPGGSGELSKLFALGTERTRFTFQKHHLNHNGREGDVWWWWWWGGGSVGTLSHLKLP